MYKIAVIWVAHQGQPYGKWQYIQNSLPQGMIFVRTYIRDIDIWCVGLLTAVHYCITKCSYITNMQQVSIPVIHICSLMMNTFRFEDFLYVCSVMNQFHHKVT